MVRGILVRERERVGQHFGSLDDGSLSIRTASPGAVATAVTVEQPDVVLVAVDELGLDAIGRMRSVAAGRPVVAIAEQHDRSLLLEAVDAGAADAIAWNRTAADCLVDRLRCTVRRHRRQQAPGDLDGDSTDARAVDDPALLLDEDGRIFQAGEPFERLLERSVAEDAPTPLAELLPIDERQRNDLSAVLDPDRQQLDWRTVELPLVRADGSRVTVTLSITDTSTETITSTGVDEPPPVAAFLDPASEIAGSSSDTGSRQCRDEDADRPLVSGSREEPIFKQLLETTQELMVAETPEAIAASVAAATSGLLDCTRAAVRFREEETLSLVATTGETAGVDLPKTVPIGDGTVGTAFERGECVSSLEHVTVQPDHATGGVAESGPDPTVLAVPIRRHGTLSVVTADGSPFHDDQRHLAELLAAAAATALERANRASRIRELLRETQSLLEAKTPRDVCERTLDAMCDLFVDDAISVYLLDDDDECLEPIAWSERTEELLGEPPCIPRGEGQVWEAIDSGELRKYDDLKKEGDPLNEETDVTSALHVPLDGHGVILAGSPDPCAFDEVDRQLTRLLGVNVSRTLDRVQRQQELREYEAAFEAVGHMMLVCDRSGRITHATTPLTDRIGREHDVIVGRPVAELFESEHRETIRNALDSTKEPGALLDASEAGSDEIDTQLRTTSGQSVPVTLELDRLPGSEERTVVTIHDRSELVEKQSQLARERDRFTYLFDHLPDAVVEVELGEDGPLVLSANSAFEDIFGYDQEAIVGHSLNDLIVPEDQREAAKRMDDRALDGTINICEVERMTETGLRQFLCRGIPYDVDDEQAYGFGIYTDITEQKERQQHLEVIHRVLRHNLRNDINVILGGLDVLEPAVEGREQQFLENLRSTARGLVRMSHKAKELAAALDVDIDDCEPTNLATVVERVLDICQDRYEEVTFETAVDDRIVDVKPDVLASAITELIENAVEHGDADTVRIGLESAGDDVRLHVADDGPGIPSYEREVVTGGTITPLQHGSGLGLWLVRRAAEACGGSMYFEDDGPLSGGSVTLELRQANPSRDHDPSGEKEAQTS